MAIQGYNSSKCTTYFTWCFDVLAEYNSDDHSIPAADTQVKLYSLEVLTA